MNVQTNLYTRLVQAATGKLRAELDAVNGQLHNIDRAERIARRLRDIELDASAEAGPGAVPFIVLRLPIELLQLQGNVIALVRNTLERKLVQNGRDSQGRDCFQILDDERASLALVVEPI
ncbi:hypothetical protein [Chromobacterium haemolyticum]|uniref:hypothetical protein n=1 Tax=Chromobacterium haemolyticum TaxID=394935 RepID=UPI0017473C1A|nr:hypothetical protein [Chromobacterium haemolyticum]QOD81652.1 hypothetical protein IEZ30_17335 [Chromobacterium haemolyticum]